MCTLRGPLCVGSLLLVAAATIGAWAEESGQKNGIKTLLEHVVLDDGQSLAEVRKFCDSRIIAMPRDITWSAWQHEAERIGEACWITLSSAACRPHGAMRRAASSGSTRSPADPATGSRSCATKLSPACGFPRCFYEPDELEGRVPVVLNVNGHDSKGKAAPYKQIRCINLAKRGMLALNVEWLGMGQLQGDGFSHNRMNQLDLCGTSGLAVFYLAMERGLDMLVDHPHADVERVAMAGLSGGGWQTILFSSLDRRVTLANPVAGYSSFKTRVEFFSDLGDSEQTPTDLAMLADYTHLTAMRAPRPTLLTYNAKDECCFASAHALPPLLDAVTPDLQVGRAPNRGCARMSTQIPARTTSSARIARHSTRCSAITFTPATRRSTPRKSSRRTK